MSRTPLRPSSIADVDRLVTTTIADIYFVHQRGLRLAMWGLCLSVGVGGGQIISGYIIQDLGKTLSSLTDSPLAN